MKTVNDIFRLYTNGSNKNDIVVAVVDSSGTYYPCTVYSDTNSDFTVGLSEGCEEGRTEAPTLTDMFEVFCTNNISRDEKISVSCGSESMIVKDLNYDNALKEIYLYV